MLDKPIRVWVDPNRSVFLVWNTEDVQRLRKHRIVGELVGTLVGHKSQNDYLGLPLQLSTEEVAIGCIYGKIVIHSVILSFIPSKVFWNWLLGKRVFSILQ